MNFVKFPSVFALCFFISVFNLNRSSSDKSGIFGVLASFWYICIILISHSFHIEGFFDERCIFFQFSFIFLDVPISDWHEIMGGFSVTMQTTTNYLAFLWKNILLIRNLCICCLCYTCDKTTLSPVETRHWKPERLRGFKKMLSQSLV